jgi:hypothetical protein
VLTRIQIGLSQVQNFLYVAYVDKVHVYRPEYPRQTLSDKPLLILNPPQTPLATHGYIDSNNPHSINHLIVDFLGDLEIVLLACDDGDVIGYYTHEISAAIERRDESDGPDSIEGFEVRAFFQQNVKLSAWGLSIHTRSRKIAVSANTHEVTVFPFGLATSLYNDGRLLDDQPLDKIILNDPGNRDNDQKFVLPAMNNNVPSVAFCNTDDDPEGRLLVSGEILGSIYLWDLHQLNVVELIRAEYCVFAEGRTCACDMREQFPHAIWGLSWLDKKSFRKFKHYAAPSEQAFRSCWDGENVRWMLPEAEPSYTFLRARGSAAFASIDPTHEPTPQPSEETIMDDDDSEDSDEEDDAMLDFVETPNPFPGEVSAHWKLRENDVVKSLSKNKHPWSGELPQSS